MTKTYTVKQVAEILGYSTNSIYTFLQEGRIKGVRVGKGRFRVPEDELNRVLHLSKKSEVITAEVTQTKEIEKTVIPSQEPVELKTVNPQINLSSFHIANIFDWFIGASAIVLGASLVLYGFKKGRLEFAEFLPWLNTISFSFVAGGLGLIMTDLMHKKITPVWNKFFYLVLILNYAFFAFINLRMADFSGLLLFGLIALIAGFKFLFPLSGVRSFLLFLVLYGLGLGIGYLSGVQIPVEALIVETIAENRVLYGSLWIVGVLIAGLIMFVGEKKVSVMFWVFMLLLGGVFIINSIFFAKNLAWSKSFFLIVTGLTCFLLPVWLVLRVAHENQRRTLAFTFGAMVGILLLGVGVIWIMQQNMAEYAARDLSSRLDFGQILVQERIDSIKKTVQDASSNNLLIKAVEGENSEELFTLLKLIYSSNSSVEKFLVVQPEGKILGVYPYTDANSTDEYAGLVSELVSKDDVYLFDNVPAKAGPEKINIRVSSALKNKDGETIGVLVGEIDLIKLKNDLQELANPANDEYFLLYNKGGKIIINPDKGINFMTESLVDNELIESYNFQGQRVYELSEKIESLGWTLRINSSVDRLFSPTKTVSISIFLAAVAFVGGISLWLVMEKRKYA